MSAETGEPPLIVPEMSMQDVVDAFDNEEYIVEWHWPTFCEEFLIFFFSPISVVYVVARYGLKGVWNRTVTNGGHVLLTIIASVPFNFVLIDPSILTKSFLVYEYIT
jgi:hypothetical protein